MHCKFLLHAWGSCCMPLAYLMNCPSDHLLGIDNFVCILLTLLIECRVVMVLLMGFTTWHFHKSFAIPFYQIQAFITTHSTFLDGKRFLQDKNAKYIYMYIYIHTRTHNFKITGLSFFRTPSIYQVGLKYMIYSIHIAWENHSYLSLS